MAISYNAVMTDAQVANDYDLLVYALENGGIEEEPDENDEPELKHCPFCKSSENIMFKESPQQNGRGYYCCYSCGAKSGNGEYGYYLVDRKQRAADKWNTRATTPTEPIDDTPKSLLEELARLIVGMVDWEEVVKNRLED